MIVVAFLEDSDHSRRRQTKPRTRTPQCARPTEDSQPTSARRDLDKVGPKCKMRGGAALYGLEMPFELIERPPNERF